MPRPIDVGTVLDTSITVTLLLEACDN